MLVICETKLNESIQNLTDTKNTINKQIQIHAIRHEKKNTKNIKNGIRMVKLSLIISLIFKHLGEFIK